MYNEQDQSSTPESVRQVAFAVRALIEDGQIASLARVAEYLTLTHPSAALERCQRAEHLGLICNVEPSPDRLPIYEPISQPLPTAGPRRRFAAVLRWMKRLAARQRRQSHLGAPRLQVEHDESSQEHSQ